jgi:hypothetical protein
VGRFPASGVRAFAAAIAMILVGALIAGAAGDRVWLQAIGLALAGTGGVVGVATAFYIIGRSEDIDRERRKQ